LIEIFKHWGGSKKKKEILIKANLRKIELPDRCTICSYIVETGSKGWFCRKFDFRFDFRPDNIVCDEFPKEG